MRSALLALLVVPAPTDAGLKITPLGKTTKKLSRRDEGRGTARKWAAVKRLFGDDAGRVVAKQLRANPGGNTSVRARDPLVWKPEGYFRRHRDLGQVFTAPRDFTLDAVVLRTGPGDLAYLPGTAGSPAFVQFFKVSGSPRINNNGTPPGTDAEHGWLKNHRCDDFLVGVTYKSMRVVSGGVMPEVEGDGRLTYMKWDFTGDDEFRFKKGERYAFMIGIAEPGPKRNFTLANRNDAGDGAAPEMNDNYPDGWALRREGNGKLPPTRRPGPKPPAAAEKLKAESRFPDGDARFDIPPTTEGYPDVDTYRDFEFYLIAE